MYLEKTEAENKNEENIERHECQKRKLGKA